MISGVRMFRSPTAFGITVFTNMLRCRIRYWPIQLDIRKLNALKWTSSPTGQHQVFAMTRRRTRSGCLRAKSRPIGPPQSFMNRVMSRRSR